MEYKRKDDALAISQVGIGQDRKSMDPHVLVDYGGCHTTSELKYILPE